MSFFFLTELKLTTFPHERTCHEVQQKFKKQCMSLVKYIYMALARQCLTMSKPVSTHIHNISTQY